MDVDHIMLIKDQIMLLGCVFIIFEHFKYRTPLNSSFLSKIYTFPRIALHHILAMCNTPPSVECTPHTHIHTHTLGNPREVTFTPQSEGSSQG